MVISIPTIEKKLVRTMLSRPFSWDSINISLLMIGLLLAGSLIFWETEFGPNMPLSWSKLTNGDYGGLFYSLFAHADAKHLVSNSYMFFIMSVLLYNYFGFLLHPLLSLPAAMITGAVTVYDTPVSLIGASGWVYVLAGMWLVLFLLIEKRHSMGSRILRVIGVSLVVLFPSTFEPNVSYEAHAWGYLFGAITGALYYWPNRHRFEALNEYRIIFPDPEEAFPQ